MNNEDMHDLNVKTDDDDDGDNKMNEKQNNYKITAMNESVYTEWDSSHVVGLKEKSYSSKYNKREDTKQG